MKKMNLCILLTVLLVFVLSACGQKAAESPYAGKWYAVAGKESAETEYIVYLETDKNFCVEVLDTKNVNLIINEEVSKIKWTEENGKCTFDMDGESIEGEIKENYMYMYDVDGMDVVFGKEGTDAEDVKYFMTEEEKELLGVWKPVLALDALGVELDDAAFAELAGMSLTEGFGLELHNDHTATMHVLDRGEETFTWFFFEGEGFFNEETPTVMFIVEDDVLTVRVSDDTMYYDFICERE